MKSHSAVSQLDDVANAACFIAGTLILTATGKKAIEDVQVGDCVYAEDVKTREQGIKEVKTVYCHDTDTLLHLTIDGEEIVTTETHPFFVEGRGWVEAGSLKAEDKVYDSTNDTLEIEKIEFEKLDAPVIVYNFEVEDYHTYYVGVHTILVHNSCAKPTNGGNRPPNMSPKGAGRTGAFKEAKRQNGVPVTEQPKKVTPNINKREKKVPGRQYLFKNGTIIRDDVAGHRFKDDPLQDRDSHFNDPMGRHYDY